VPEASLTSRTVQPKKKRRRSLAAALAAIKAKADKQAAEAAAKVAAAAKAEADAEAARAEAAAAAKSAAVAAGQAREFEAQEDALAAAAAADKVLTKLSEFRSKTFNLPKAPFRRKAVGQNLRKMAADSGVAIHGTNQPGEFPRAVLKVVAAALGVARVEELNGSFIRQVQEYVEREIREIREIPDKVGAAGRAAQPSSATTATEGCSLPARRCAALPGACGHMPHQQHHTSLSNNTVPHRTTPTTHHTTRNNTTPYRTARSALHHRHTSAGATIRIMSSTPRLALSRTARPRSKRYVIPSLP
jgi:hypothetical protein